MKSKIIQIFIAVFFLQIVLSGQENTDSTGFAGDNFSLEGALELLQKSESLEAFEKNLNIENSYVNNLDLNEDGNIDYIKVIDNVEDDVHAIVLQVDISAEESQDIAVILIEKTSAENAVLQIVGDEDVYGEEKIVEPYAESMDTGGKGMAFETFGAPRIVVNVWTWPSVRYVYGPSYVVYRSPWRWSVYPNWWKPWRPHPWRWHYSKRTVYHVHFKPYHKHRVVKAHKIYTPKRKTSVSVRTKTVKTRTVVNKGKGTKVERTKVTKKTKVERTKVTKKTKVERKGKKGKKEKNATKQSKKSKKSKTVKSRKGEKTTTKKTKRTKSSRK